MHADIVSPWAENNDYIWFHCRIAAAAAAICSTLAVSNVVLLCKYSLEINPIVNSLRVFNRFAIYFESFPLTSISERENNLSCQWKKKSHLHTTWVRGNLEKEYLEISIQLFFDDSI